MHPLMRSPKSLVLTLLFWLPLSGGIISLQNIISGGGWISTGILLAPPLLVLLFFLLSTWYLSKSIELEMQNYFILLSQHLLAAVAVILIWLFSAMLYSEILVIVTKSAAWRQMFNRALPLLSAVSTLFYFLSISFNYLVLAMEKIRNAEKEALENRLAASSAELRALQSTIHPHFLFNSLTALTSLIHVEPGKAEEACRKLSDFLRYSIKYGQRGFVTLAEEMDRVADYLSIEQIRLGERLKIKMQIAPEAQKLLIPPLILLPLVENSIKHGVSQQILGGELSLKITRENEYVNVVIKNPLSDNGAANYGEGLGLSTLRKKLDSVYGPKYHLEIEKSKETFTAKLWLPPVVDNIRS